MVLPHQEEMEKVSTGTQKNIGGGIRANTDVERDRSFPPIRTPLYPFLYSSGIPHPGDQGKSKSDRHEKI